MKIATMINTPKQAIAEAREKEEQGFDVIMTNESDHDPFIMSTLIAERTERVEIFTYIAVAFARNPMLAAYSAHDVQQIAKGRFVLGLGSQIKPHIERRFSMPWSNPAPRMRDFVEAMHAIWDCWYDGKPLEHEGRFYRHTLMIPEFTPKDLVYPRPKVGVAAVGPEMCKTAAQVGDRLLCHAFTTPEYMREVTLPMIDAAMAKANRPRDRLELVGMPFIAAGSTPEDLAEAKAMAREHLAFYGSTPAYVGVLEAHGLAAVHGELKRMSKEGRWKEMGALVDDDFLNAFAVVGTPEECARSIIDRFGGIFDIVCGYQGSKPGMPVEVMREIKRLQRQAA